MLKLASVITHYEYYTVAMPSSQSRYLEEREKKDINFFLKCVCALYNKLTNAAFILVVVDFI